MRRAHWLLKLTWPSLALALGACGNLDNTPFRTGTVHGRLTEFDPAVALVSLVGAPDARGTVDAEGRFTLADVPAGPAELFIVATASKAARVPLTVQGGQSVAVEDVAPRPAGTLDLKVKSRGSLKLTQAQVSLVGTPFQALRLDVAGKQRIGPLPEGCYEVRVLAPDFATASGQGCVGPGEQKLLKLELIPEDAWGQRGCAETGCDSDTHCAPNGQCVGCLDDSQCAAPLACRGMRCEGPGAECAPCEGHWQCTPAARCADVPGNAMACVMDCGVGRPACTDGLTCQDGHCLPDPSRFATCGDFRQ
ncbi:carboxypeptidase-like regulatory domain-containing protein [Corallococcus sp. BB11-1]|uniref:carboxypeptidase-like regulatory domain-containing protein n=1 Tax=Corallococcus sp. BB11-1 TaxID=2996783 RepID=UPI0010D5A284|nr:carboxypeptidase-like regulatory domain-containing protein [Corallococcus sp. BB11-1]MCY1034586.1 carboxypeptidase-like regulatory domain-containing protein [Corallococcus sp. BB11-1]RYZ44339.1 MAG: carboxypeptidase regulatory-like domain-containing protein [Myxococcaceae bacterium]